MSAQNSAGIQTLLDAEREASKIVQKAREFRTKRVKEARDEAKNEIANYKSQKEEEFKKFEAEVRLSKVPIAERLLIICSTAKEINKQKTRQTRRLRNRFSSLRKLARRARQAWSRTSWLLSSRPSHSRLSAHNGWWLVMRQRVAK